MDQYKNEVLQFAYQKNLGITDALVYALDRWTEMLDSKENAGIQVLF